ncbi:MAG: O-acetyl-ADP-ribose deacetylase [Burkholderiales bacterium]|nr:O-acetyl-ADP-ribose deacetylase [Anaerolineae bacterium]
MNNSTVTHAKIKRTVIELVQGDITEQDVDAIVNAANNTLLGGGGVDGAIHRAAGPGLVAATKKLGGCATGDAKISGGYNLKARHVIHAVGPMYRVGDPNSPKLLASTYRRSLEVAAQNEVKTIAFAAISTGVYRYPLGESAKIALQTVCDFVSAKNSIKLVRFVLFTEEALAEFQGALDTMTRERDDLNYA